MENYRLEKRTSRKSLYGVVWLVFGIGLFALFASVFLTYATGGAWLKGLFASGSPFGLALLLVGFVAFFAVSWFGRRMKLVTLVILYAFIIPFFAIAINISLLVYLPDVDLLPVLGIMMIPGGIMMIMGAIGYYELVNIRNVQTILIFLVVGFIIAFIISFFVRNDGFSWWISVLAVAIISLGTIIDFFMMRREIETAEYGDSREMFKVAAFYGIRMFFNYAILLLYVIRIFGGRR